MKLPAVQFFPVSCHLLSLTPQISPSTSYFQTPSAYVPPSMRETKFHTHTTQRAKLESYTFQSLYSWTSHRKTKDSAPKGSRHCLSLVLLISSASSSGMSASLRHMGTCLTVGGQSPCPTEQLYSRGICASTKPKSRCSQPAA